MRFLVSIEVRLPPTLGEADRRRLLADELERGRRLKAEGAIVAIWRVPGAPLRNVGLWEAADATALHELIASLPLFPYLETEVVPLARHPIDDDG